MDDQAGVASFDLAELDGAAIAGAAGGDLSLVLDVPVELERAYRDAYPMAVARGIPFHITLLFPFVPAARLGDDELARVRALAARHEPFGFALTRVETFPEAVWLAPEPVDELRGLEAVAGLGVDRHGDVDAAADAPRGGEHLLRGRAFVVLVAEGGGHAAARRRHDGEARGDDRACRGDVPRVRQDERPAPHVERPKKVAAALEGLCGHRTRLEAQYRWHVAERAVIHLTLVQPRVLRREWELRREDEVLAVLRLSTFLPRARAEISGRPLRIEQRGWRRVAVVVYEEGTDEQVARLRRDGRRRVLALDGRTFDWKRLGRKEGFAFVAEGGEPLLTAKPGSGVLRFSGELTVAASLPEPDAVVMALLAGYLLIHRGAAAVVGATAAVAAASG
jgi:hypothetical protein